MIRLALAAFVVAACGARSEPVEPLSSNAAPPPTPRDTPAPTIAWGDHRLEAVGLPAAARGGELVVVALHEGDGGRGYPNLHVEVRDRSDRTIQSIPVAESDEYERLAPNGEPGKELAERIAEANRQLARLHGVHDLIAMHKLELQPTEDGGDKHLAIGDGFDVDWNGDHLHVFHHNTDQSLLTESGLPWLAPEHKPCPTCEPCANPAYLANVYHADAMNLFVVELAYKGTDTCWEPGNQLHVVTWP